MSSDDCVGCGRTAAQCRSDGPGVDCCVLCRDEEHNGAHIEGARAGYCNICEEPLEPGGLAEILDHIRVIHPGVYGDGPELWPDGGLVVEVDESFDITADDFIEGLPPTP